MIVTKYKKDKGGKKPDFLMEKTQTADHLFLGGGVIRRTDKYVSLW